MIWTQEEPQNKGAWSYMNIHLRKTMGLAGFTEDLKYVGRGFRASPATGSKAVHEREQRKIVEDVFS